MDIVYTFDNNYIPQIATSICSICENNKNNDLSFHLVWLNLTKDSKSKLEKLVKNYNKTLHIYDLPPLQTFFDFDYDTWVWNPIVLARLVIDKILPADISKILFIDWDTMVRWDLKWLWETFLPNKTLWMVWNPIDKKRRTSLWLNNYVYHNAWVCFMNLKRFREKDFWTKMIEYYKANNWRLYANDQDLINIVLKDEIYELLPSYNYWPDFYETTYKYVKNNIWVPEYFDLDVYNQACKNPIIVHYYWVRKPRREKSNAIYQEEYDYYSKIVWYKNIEKWRKTYFFFLDMYDFFTLPFPNLRIFIRDILIKLYDLRKGLSKKK